MPEFVRVRDCACPETPHAEEGDGVLLRSTLSAAGGIVAEQDLNRGYRDQDELVARLLPQLVRSEAIGWNFLDDKGDPLPFDVDALMADWRIARPVVLKAGELYLEVVIAPFVQTPPTPSRTGRTRATTSAPPSPTPSPSE